LKRSVAYLAVFLERKTKAWFKWGQPPVGKSEIKDQRLMPKEPKLKISDLC